jgi:hypothetical protein
LSTHEFHPKNGAVLPARLNAGAMRNNGRGQAFNCSKCYLIKWRIDMPVLLGFILGVAMTIAGAFLYDSSTGRAANGLASTAAAGQAPMVNWDVVSDDWRILQTDVRTTADNLQRKLKQHTG